MNNIYPGYIGDLGNGQQLLIQQRGQQTVITLSSMAVGQQQSQSSYLDSGEWSAPPTLFQTSSGVVLRLESLQGPSFIQLQSNRIQSLSQSPSLAQAEVMPLRPTTAEEMSHTGPSRQPMEPMKPMESMKPMEPMTMGNMEMQMNPMQMRMGNMEMRMGESSPQTKASSPQKRFCSQCGQAIEVGDRFCAYCGHQLT